MAFESFDLKSTTRTLFRRCVQCPDSPPTCPVCPSGQTCSLVGGNCDTCQASVCTKVGASDSSSPPQPPTKHSSAAGPIAGGVIGGVVLIAVITYLLWRFWIKKKRESFVPSEWNIDDLRSEKSPAHSQFPVNRDARASTHTVGSIASTVLTRASNIIQIAYIPGVTNRSESSPDLIPPVPPIPAFSPAHSAASTPQPGQADQHFFMPADLRDSTYSGYTEGDNRTSYARSSMSPSMMRSSVATNVYRNNAVVNPVPAQIATRFKPGVVSVKSSGVNSPIEGSIPLSPPPMPENAKSVSRNGPLQSSIVGRLGVPRTVTVTKSNNNLMATSQAQSTKPPNPSGLRQSNTTPSSTTSDASHKQILLQHRPNGRTPSIHDGKSSTFDDASSSEDDSPSNRSLMSSHQQQQQQQQQQREYAALMASEIQAATRLGHSAFKSPSSAPDLRTNNDAGKPHEDQVVELAGSGPSTGYASARDQRHKRSGSLNQIIEEATRRASREPRHGGLGGIGQQGGGLGATSAGRRPSRDKEGPFSDDNAAATP